MLHRLLSLIKFLNGQDRCTLFERYPESLNGDQHERSIKPTAGEVAVGITNVLHFSKTLKPLKISFNCGYHSSMQLFLKVGTYTVVLSINRLVG